MILICYDGSQDSHAAIQRAAELMPNEAATVLTVWEPLADVIARTCARGATIAESILSVADDVKANAIVLGTRGLTGLKSLWLGSVSHAVVQHADRPVIIVPSSELAARRTVGRRP